MLVIFKKKTKIILQKIYYYINKICIFNNIITSFHKKYVLTKKIKGLNQLKYILKFCFLKKIF